LSDAIEIVSEVEYSRIPSFIREADIGLALYPPTESMSICSPSKLVEYMSIGLPSIGNRETADLASIMTGSGYGRLCDYDKDQLVQAINETISDYGNIISENRKGIDWIEANRVYPIFAKMIHDRYLELAGKGEQ